MARSIEHQNYEAIVDTLGKSATPLTSSQIADKAGLKRKRIASSLSYMYRIKAVKRNKMDDPENEGRKCFVYELTKKGEARTMTEVQMQPRRRRRKINGAIEALIVLQYGTKESITVTMSQAKEIWTQLKGFHRSFRR